MWNIYADEALFRAKIHLRPVGNLRRPQVAASDAVVDALEAGIEAKGASIDDTVTRTAPRAPSGRVRPMAARASPARAAAARSARRA